MTTIFAVNPTAKLLRPAATIEHRILYGFQFYQRFEKIVRFVFKKLVVLGGMETADKYKQSLAVEIRVVCISSP